MTLTVTVQDELTAIDALVREIEEPPAVAVNAPPLHVVVAPFGEATFKLVGRVSVNPTPVSAVPAFGFASVKLT